MQQHLTSTVCKLRLLLLLASESTVGIADCCSVPLPCAAVDQGDMKALCYTN